MNDAAQRKTSPPRKKQQADPPDMDLESAVGFLFRRADSLASKLFYEFSEQTTLSPRQFGVLLTLSKSGPMSPRELSDIIHIDPSTLGEMLRRMEERGLIARHTGPSDRRKVNLALAAGGKRALRAHLPSALRVQEQLLAPILPEQRNILIGSLQRILGRFEG
jgi:DNA-binding MarR family transcriptional regulator